MKFGMQTRYSFFVVSLVLAVVGLMSVAHLFEFRAMVSGASRATTEAVSTSLLGQAKNEGEALSRFMTASIADHVYRLEVDVINDHVKAMSRQKGILYVSVVDDRDRVISEIVSGAITYRDAPMTGDVIDRELASGRIVSGARGSTLHLVAPILLGSRVVGRIKLGLSLARIQSDIGSVTRHIETITAESGREFLTLYIVIAVVVTLIGLGVSLVMVRNLAGAIGDLSRYARRIGTGEYEMPPPPPRVSGTGELAILARNLDGIAKNLKQVSQVSKLATLGEMAVGMAHELNQPLNTIRLAAENTQHAIEDGVSDREFELSKLQLISEQAGRMGEMIQRMCIVGRSEGPLEVIDPSEAIEDACSLLVAQFEDENIAVTVDMPREPVYVRGRRNELAQVLINFMTNARDAILSVRTENTDQMPGTGGRIDIILESRSDSVLIQVKDNGGGIPAEVVERIFDPFFTTKAVTKGTGLGLSISFGIINAMQGQIMVENFGGGAIFTIRLPRSDRDEMPELSTAR